MNGCVSVLLRIDNPDQHVDQLHQPIDFHPMVHLGGVMIRKVQQDEAVERRSDAGIGLQRMPSRDLEPVQQIFGRFGAPAAGHRVCRRRAAYADSCQSGSRQGIEDARLARSCGPSERDHRGASGNGQPTVGLVAYAPGIVQGTGIDSALAQLNGLAECPKMINQMCPGVLAAE
jgi:hypothetical protein